MSEKSHGVRRRLAIPCGLRECCRTGKRLTNAARISKARSEKRLLTFSPSSKRSAPALRRSRTPRKSDGKKSRGFYPGFFYNTYYNINHFKTCQKKTNQNSKNPVISTLSVDFTGFLNGAREETCVHFVFPCGGRGNKIKESPSVRTGR